MIGARKFSRRLHMNEEQKKQLKKDISDYEKEMDEKAVGLFKQMTSAINDAVGTPMVDPMTRQKVGASDINEVILEQVRTFDIKWAKGSKESPRGRPRRCTSSSGPASRPSSPRRLARSAT